VLESGPGHAIRCLPTDYAQEFEREKRRLLAAGQSSAEVTARLDLLQLGRLRLAARGVTRGDSGQLAPASPEEQVRGGVFMIGQLAALRHGLTTLTELHREVCEASTHLLERLAMPAPARRRRRAQREEVAIIGLASLLPGAPTVRAYWQNILGKVCAIREVPETYWHPERVYSPDRTARDHTYSRWGGFLDPVPFDPVEWGMPPSSMPATDPMQLLGLLCAREALRDAGYLERPFDRSRAAVIMGVSGGIGQLGGLYALRSGFPQLFGPQTWELLEQAGDALPTWTEDSFPGLLPNVVPGRISNRLDLSGPNYAVDAACASSLAAVSAALQELKLGEVDLALVGGVDASQGFFGYLCFGATQALSPRGQASVFDEAADGIVTGEGAAMLVLKRRAEAERDGDRIYALVQGVGSSSDGRARGLTAPRMEGQLEALRRAYRRCGLSPAAVGLFEAHGTGTAAGDRSEAEALRTLAQEARARPRSQAVGSVKSMIGHTKAAAGAAGLVKAALALHHHVLPPTLGVTRPLPGVGFEDSPLYLNTETRPWLRPVSAQPRLAAVSGFGFGGTNFHVVLEEYDGAHLGPPEAPCDRWPAELLAWAAASREELARDLGALTAQLDRGAAPELRDLAYTLWQQATPLLRAGRCLRLALVAADLADLHEKLLAARDRLSATSEAPSPRGVYFSQAPPAQRGKLAYLFPGQGSQYPHMLRELAVLFPEVREAFETAQEALKDRLPVPLGQLVFPAPAFTADEEQAQREALTGAHVAQPALGAASLGLLRLLENLEIRPDLLAGHSFGEYLALAAAGVYDGAGLARLAEARGRCFAASEPGVMLAAQAGREQVATALEGLPEVWIANVNSPTQTVLAGSPAGVRAAGERLAAAGVPLRSLPVAHAFHSPLMRAAQTRLAELLAATPLLPPRLEVFSNTKAEPYPSNPEQIRRWLVEHCAHPVEFVAEIEALYAAGARVFLEVGPRAVLTPLVRAILTPRPHLAVSTDPSPGGVTPLLQALGQLLAHGVHMSLDRLFAGRAVRSLDLAALPTENQPPWSSTTWLVNGCGSWPAQEPAPLAADGFLTLGGPVSAWNRPASIALSGVGEDPVMAHHQAFLRELDAASQEVLTLYQASLGHREPGGAPRPPEASTAPPADLPARPADLGEALLRVVAERTGYPPAMLAPDLHLEADLGLDSIKRMEILAAVQAECLPPGASLSTPEMEELLRLTTLREIADWLGRHAQPGVAPPPQAPHQPAPTGEVTRLVLREAPAPALPPALPSFPPDRVVLITDDERGLAEALAERLRECGGRPVLVRHVSGADVSQGPPYQVDLTSPPAVQALVARVRAEHGPLCGLLHLLPLALGPPLEGMALSDWQERQRQGVKSLFYLAQAAADLRTPEGGDRAWLLAAMDASVCPGHAGLAGFLATAAREWPQIICKAVDLTAKTAPAQAAALLLREMAANDGLVRVRYAGDVRWQVSAEAQSLDDRLLAAVTPAADWVFLLTGGARGLTAQIALELAERYQPTLILAGRSAPPAPESAATQNLTTPSELKLALLEELQRAGQPAGVREVEAAYRRLLQDREIRETLAALAKTGAQVRYYQADVRDEAVLAGLLRQIQAEHGRLNVVIHGAGVIEDKLIADKRPDSFDRVFDTKADSAFLLSRLLDPATLRCLMFFTSIVGPLGNAGQSDYAAANEAVSELAAHLDRTWPGRVVAIAWGPWAQRGMVTAELKGILAERGLSLMPPEAGRELCLRELTHGASGQPHVVLAAGAAVEAWAASRPVPPTLPGPRLPEVCAALPLLQRANLLCHTADELEAVRDFDPAHDLYLDHHRLRGRAVVPAAMALEFMAEAALALAPGLQLTQVSDFQVLHGIILNTDPARVRVLAQRNPGARAAGGATTVTVELVEGQRNGHANYRASLELSRSFPLPPLAPPAPELESFGLLMAEVYPRYLFHGPLMQGLVAMEGLGPAGASGILTSSLPQALLAGAPPGRWVLDPVMFDSALQLGYLWARLRYDLLALPARFARCRLFAPVGKGPVRCLLAGATRKGDFAVQTNLSVCDLSGWTLLLLEGLEAVGSRSLSLLAEERP
jgi:acyl transferase domain-containing protein/NAD(P)-dependent dehydrogenase (short-subunit alcohol dehydrogenase family)